MEVWENEKCCGNTNRRRVFPQLFHVNSIETRSTGFTCYLWLSECKFSLLMPSLRQQRALVLCLHRVIQTRFLTACSTSRNTRTPEHGTPEHHGTFRNTRKTRNTPKNPEHSLENQEHPKKTRNTPKKTRNIPKKIPKKTRNTPKKPPEISKSRCTDNMLPRAWASLNYRHSLHIR